MTRGAHAPLGAAQLDELARELAPLALGARVKAVQGLPPRDVLLVLEPDAGADDPLGGRIRRLRLSADPHHARLHLQVGRVRRHEGPLGGFYRALAAALEGRRVLALEALPAERIVRLSADGEGPALLLEAIGAHANLVLLDAAGAVREVLVPPRPGSAAAARLAPGAAWCAPPGGAPPGAPPLADALPDPPEPAREEAALARAAPLSWRVERTLGAAAEGTLEDELRADLRRRARRRLKGASERRAGLEVQAREAEAVERLQQDAELLQAQHRALGRGHDHALVRDHYEPGSPERRLALDPRKSGRENAEALFARAKKLRKNALRLPAELELAREQERALEALLARADDPELDPHALEEEARAAGLVAARPEPRPERPREKAAPAPRQCYRLFHGRKGSEIRVGRSAADNDELTFRVARKSDLWLHTADSPGSHVVLSVPKGAQPDPEEVLDAAHLAVHFSPLSGARKADVHVAACKEVHKPRRAPAGLVTLSGGRTLRVRMEEERLARLLGGGPAGRAPEAGPARR